MYNLLWKDSDVYQQQNKLSTAIQKMKDEKLNEYILTIILFLDP